MPSLRHVIALGAVAGLLVAAAPALGPDLDREPAAAPSQLHVLPLRAGAIDPAVDLVATDPVDHDIVLVQLTTRGDTATVDALPTTGATLLQPLAPVSYLVWADAPATRAIRALPGVRFAGVLPGAHRVAGDVATATTLRVTVVDADSALAELATAITPRRFTAADGLVLDVPNTAVVRTLVAARPEVYSIADGDSLQGPAALRDERTAAIVAQGVADPTGPYDPATDLGADGTGVRVAVVDGGADLTHLELADRDITCTSYTRTLGADCLAGNTDDAIGHGTHVSGIVLGDGSTGLGDEGPGGWRFGHGVAPGADLHIQNAINLTASRPSITTLFQTSYRSGASVVQNSWGPSSTPKGYDEPTRQADAAVRDADPEEPGDQPLGVVFSIMNGSGGTSTQGAPDEGKNILAIGGSQSGRVGTSGDDLCTCSAHGPNLDGSRLVDLVAPGESVMSTRAAQGTLCGIPSTEFPSPLHGDCTGTSMASPHVSGAYAVFVEGYRAAYGTDPSPALVKAALVNTAVDLATVGPLPGRDADGTLLTPVPNEQQGWGRLFLGGTMAALNDGTAIHVDQSSTPLDASGERYELQVTVRDIGQPLRITLAYTDAPGHGQGGELRSLVNDLDLEVIAPDGTLYRGNVFAKGASVTGGERDTLNNLENVWLPTPQPGTYVVRVLATEIIGDGVPSLGDLTDQDFALVVGNAS